MRRSLVILGVAAFFVFGGPPSSACSCPMPTSLSDLADRSTAVFTGTVERVSGALPFGISCSSASPVTIEFTVDTVYKGEVARSTIVRSVASGASCGFEVTVGKRYTVFPWSIDGKLDAGLCRGNLEGDIVPADYGLPAGHPPKN